MASSADAGSRKILALDAAGSACSAAVWREGAVVACCFEAMARGQSERLVPMVETVMAEAGLAYQALDAIAVTRGPGGFTGVRIGLATARGLALASGRPVIGLDCFEAVAAGVSEAERAGRGLLVLLDAKRAEVYARLERAGEVGEALCLKPEALAARLPRIPLLLAGDAVAQAEPALRAAGYDLRPASAPGHVDAARVAELAAARGLPGPDSAPPQPLYLRPPDVTLPRRDPPGVVASKGPRGS